MRAWFVDYVLAFPVVSQVSAAGPEQPVERSETRGRPLRVEKCWRRHEPAQPNGGPRCDSAAGVAKGGETGPAVFTAKAGEDRERALAHVRGEVVREILA